MVEQIHAVDDVFGVNRDLPLNYVVRERVDGKLIDSLSRNQHIVIYGSSKQGKTSLRKHCLRDDDYIVISCQNRWTLTQLNSAILKRAGFKVELSESKSSTGQNKILVEFEGEGGGFRSSLRLKVRAVMSGRLKKRTSSS